MKVVYIFLILQQNSIPFKKKSYNLTPDIPTSQHPDQINVVLFF